MQFWDAGCVSENTKCRRLADQPGLVGGLGLVVSISQRKGVPPAGLYYSGLEAKWPPLLKLGTLSLPFLRLGSTFLQHFLKCHSQALIEKNTFKRQRFAGFLKRHEFNCWLKDHFYLKTQAAELINPLWSTKNGRGSLLPGASFRQWLPGESPSVEVRICLQETKGGIWICSSPWETLVSKIRDVSIYLKLN